MSLKNINQPIDEAAEQIPAADNNDVVIVIDEPQAPAESNPADSPAAEAEEQPAEAKERPAGETPNGPTAASVDMQAFAAAIAEAEERGYRRGCAQAQKSQPEAEQAQRGTYQVPAGDNNQNNSTPTFLSHIRTGFWD